MKIAVFRALFLGDMLCAVPALRALRTRFSEAQITLIGLPWARELIARFPYVDRFEEFPGFPSIPEVPYDQGQTEGFLGRMRAEGFDLAVQLHGDGRTSNGFVAALGARATVGFRNVEDDDRLTLGLAWDPNEHEVRRWLRLVAALGADAGDPRLEFPLLPEEERLAAVLLDEAPFTSGLLIGFHPGAKDAARRWPAERFALLADRLHEQYHARFVVTGAEDDRDLATAVQRRTRAPVLDLTGRTAKLGVFAALLARLDMLVTNDTGASHLVAAMGTRSVILFGPSRPARWAPLDRWRHAVVDALQYAPPGSDPATALADLPVEPVVAACERLLWGNGSLMAAVAPAAGSSCSLN